jgi:hypothetical protein
MRLNALNGIEAIANQVEFFELDLLVALICDILYGLCQIILRGSLPRWFMLQCCCETALLDMLN